MRLQVILKKRETNLKRIFELLRKEQANKCVYGADPRIEDLCPDLMSIKSYAAAIPNLRELRMSDVRAHVVDDGIVRDLIDTCPIGEWCLDINILDSRPVRLANATVKSVSNTIPSLGFKKESAITNQYRIRDCSA